MTRSTALSSGSVAAESLDTSGSSQSYAGAVAGGIVGVVVAAVIGSAALLYVRRKRRRELKQSRAARMTTRASTYLGGDGSGEPKGDYEAENFDAQPVYHDEAPVGPQANEPPALVDDGSKEMIQQQQQYYQTQSPIAVQQQLPAQNLAQTIPPAMPAAAAVAGGAVAVAPATAPPEAQAASSLGTFTVIATYVPTLSDELEIEPGDRIELLVEYDDGWCQGINVTRNYAKGVFPRHCIDHADAALDHKLNADIERTKRVSSMYVMGPR
jgi:hypothetical protein